VTGDPTWNFQDPASKDRILRVLHEEIDEMFVLVSDPAHWNTTTACEGWEVRDMVGHLVDATQGFLSGFDVGRRGGSPGDAVGVAGMAKASDEAARAFRSVAREDLLAQLRGTTERLLKELESLTAEEWSSLVVADPYMGPIPAMFIVAGLLGGYTVHGWDVREGLRAPHAINGDAADLLVPFVFLLWWATADTSSVVVPYSIGVRTTGTNGGDTRCDITPDGLNFTAAAIDECPAILECDPATLVLTAYNRLNGGSVRGNRQLINDFRALFVAI
jgi:uncharacterized protein (TIGR03083 family)